MDIFSVRLVFPHNFQNLATLQQASVAVLDYSSGMSLKLSLNLGLPPSPVPSLFQDVVCVIVQLFFTFQLSEVIKNAKHWHQ